MRKTATNELIIADLKCYAHLYNTARHSKEREHAGNQVMLMLDAIIERLEHAAASN